MQKLITNFSCFVKFYWICDFCSKYFAQDCLSKQIFFWHFVYYQRISPTFIENIKQVSCVKISKLTVFVKSILHIQFRWKIDSRKLSLTLIGSFLTEPTFLNQMSLFLAIQKITWSLESKKKIFRQSWS